MITVGLIQATACDRQEAPVQKWYSTSFNCRPGHRLVAERRGLATRLTDDAFHNQSIPSIWPSSMHWPSARNSTPCLAHHRAAEHVHLTGNDHRLLLRDHRGHLFGNGRAELRKPTIPSSMPPQYCSVIQLSSRACSANFTKAGPQFQTGPVRTLSPTNTRMSLL